MRTMLVVMAMVACGPAMSAETQTQFAGGRPISVTGLSDKGTCFPGKLVGRVVKRDFEANGATLRSVTFEDASGERSLVNIDSAKMDAASTTARADATRALQTILRDGARVSAGVFECGAAGRVMMLDSAQARR